jgi:DNA-binding IclR family transcriptional regulator
VGIDYINLKEAARRSGLHSKTIQRLLREGVLDGFKSKKGATRRWLVSVNSLRLYTDPWVGHLRDLPGPKLYLRRLDEDDEDGIAW